MITEIDNACCEYVNKINEYLDHFEKKYIDFQKLILSYKREKDNDIHQVDYTVIFNLRSEISRKMNCLQREIREIIEKQLR